MQFRKSKKFGPFRAGISKGGFSLSAGVPGARISRSHKWNGKTSTTGTVGLPGTGLYASKTLGSSSANKRTSANKHEVAASQEVAEVQREVVQVSLDDVKLLSKSERRQALYASAGSLTVEQLAYRKLWNKFFTLPLFILVVALFAAMAIEPVLVFAVMAALVAMPIVQTVRFNKLMKS